MMKYLLFLLALFISPVKADCLWVFITGQSNAGWTDNYSKVPSEYQGTPSNVTYYSNYKSGFQSTFPKYSTIESQPEFGMEASLAHELSNTFPSHDIYIYKSAHPGSVIQKFQEGHPEQLHNYIVAAAEYFPPQGCSEYLVWLQGESDSTASTASSLYGSRLQTLMGDLPVNMGIDPRILVALTDPVGYYSHSNGVRNGQMDFVNGHPNAEIIETAGLSIKSDHIHYSAQGQIEMGIRVANLIIQNEGQSPPPPPAGSPEANCTCDANGCTCAMSCN